MKVKYISMIFINGTKNSTLTALYESGPPWDILPSSDQIRVELY